MSYKHWCFVFTLTLDRCLLSSVVGLHICLSKLCKLDEIITTLYLQGLLWNSFKMRLLKLMFVLGWKISNPMETVLYVCAQRQRKWKYILVVANRTMVLKYNSYTIKMTTTVRSLAGWKTIEGLIPSLSVVLTSWTIESISWSIFNQI